MRWLIPVLLLSALQARAHDADVIYVLVKHGAQPDLLVETVTLTAPSLGYLAPLDADGDGALSQGDLDAKHKALRAGVWDDMPLTPCELLEAKAWLREGYVELEGQYRCREGELRQDFKILRVLPANYRVVLGSQLDGEGQGRGFAQGSLTTIPVPRPLPPGTWDTPASRRALDVGIQRGLSPEVLGAVLAVLLSIGAWRRGLLASGLLLCGVLIGSGMSLQWWPSAIFFLLVAIGAAVSRASVDLIVPELLGLAIGLREGGGGWSTSAGLGAGTVLVLALASPIFLAIGVMLQRRPRLQRVVRWVPPVMVVIGLALHARLSW